MNLQLSLIQKLIENLGNNHLDNWDAHRFGDESQNSKTKLFPRKLDILNMQYKWLLNKSINQKMTGFSQ